MRKATCLSLRVVIGFLQVEVDIVLRVTESKDSSFSSAHCTLVVVYPSRIPGAQ
jgi:hypothetical protein